MAVARALVSQPAVLFADEPTGNLDSKTSGEVLSLLRGSVDELGQTIIMVTHDAGAASIADRILFLHDGEIVLDVGKISRDEIYDVIKYLETTTAGRDGRSPIATTTRPRERGALMFRTSLRNLTSRPLRTALTTLAILLGVAMISGTYVLTDQITNGFDDIFDRRLRGHSRRGAAQGRLHRPGRERHHADHARGAGRRRPGRRRRRDRRSQRRGAGRRPR